MREQKRLAALLLRWSAQIASGEDANVVCACTAPLRAAGLDMVALEVVARDMARSAALMIETVEDEELAVLF